MISKYFKSLDLLKAIRQFPLSSGFAVIATICSILYIDYPELDILGKTVGSGYLAFLTAISAEVYNRITERRWVLLFPFLVFIVWFIYLPQDLDDIPKYLETRYAYRYLGMTLLLHLIISFIPYLKKSSEEDFWEYNKHLFLRIFESVLFSLIIFLGLSLAILAVDKLFGINVDSEWYARLYFFLIGIFNSLYFLSKFPRIDYDGQTSKPSNSYNVFSQYILIGISSIYLVLLYAYAIKILLEGSLPRGWIGYLTLCFSIVGILTWLLNYFNPKFSSNRFIKVFKNHFFQLLTVPVIMLFIAIIVRINEYGITENRYIVATLALWLGLMTIGYGWFKSLHIKFIPISFAFLTALATFGGPLDMFGVSLRNQTKKLKHLLINNEILENRQLNVLNIESLEDDIKYELKMAINDLDNRSDMEIVNQWVEEDLFESFEGNSTMSKSNFLNKKLGIIDAYSIKSESIDFFNLTSMKNNKLNIQGYGSMVLCPISKEANDEKASIKIVDDGNLQFQNFNAQSISELVLTYQGSQVFEIPQSEMTYIFRNQTDSAKLIVDHIHGRIESGIVIIEGGQAWLLETTQD